MVGMRRTGDAEGFAQDDGAPRRAGLVDGCERAGTVTDGTGLLGLRPITKPGMSTKLTTGRWNAVAKSTKRVTFCAVAAVQPPP